MQRGLVVAGWAKQAAKRLTRPVRQHDLVCPTCAARLSAVRALLPLAAGYALSYLFRNVNGLVGADIMRDLGVGADSLGLLTSIAFLAFAAAQISVGVLLDRYGPARVQAALLLCAAAGSALSALDSGFVGLLVGRALIGFGTAGGLVAGLKAAAAWLSREQLPRINGLLVMCGGVGALLATWPVEFALNFMNWRGLAATLATLAVACAGLVYVLVPKPLPTVTVRHAQLGLRDILRDPLFQRFAPLSAACFGTVLALQGLWAGPWLADIDRLPRGDIATDLACMAAVLVVAAPCWGHMTQWVRQRMELPRAAAFAAVLMLGTELLLLAHAWLPSVLSWCMLAMFGGMTVLSYSVLAGHFPASAIGRANGALNVVHIGMSFLIQLGVGAIVGRWNQSGGHYPNRAYEAGLMLPVIIQVAALIWFAWPRRQTNCSAGPEPHRAGARTSE